MTEFAIINSDLEVMEHFPKTLTKKETAELITRLASHYTKYGFTYFAVEVLKSSELIGFIGMVFQDYKTDFTPAIDIGWRLKKNAWGKGFATEGALKCLNYGFSKLSLDKIIATCTEKNSKSESVMKNIGMEKLGSFKHPNLKEFPEYEECLCYGINKATWQAMNN